MAFASPRKRDEGVRQRRVPDSLILNPCPLRRDNGETLMSRSSRHVRLAFFRAKFLDCK